MPFIRIYVPNCLARLLLSMLCTVLYATPNSSLLNRSPFLPPQTSIKAPQANPEPSKSRFPEVQFVGFSGTAPNWSFALFFNPQNQVKWLSLGAEFAEVKVVKFDANVPSLTVEHAKQTKDIKLAQSAPASTPNPSLRRARQPNHNQATAITHPGQSTPKARSTTIPRRRIILPKKNNP